MKLQRKLLVYFISLVLGILLIFGFITYQLTHTANLDNEKRILQTLARYQADILAKSYQHNPELQHLYAHLQDTPIHPFYISILDSNNQFIRQQLPADWQDNAPALMLAEATSGQLNFAEKTWLWERVPIPGSNYQLLEIYHSQYTSNWLTSLSTRMVTTGLIILWVASWLGILISTAISKKLQAQTQAIQYQSTHDNLTGLPNRLHLYKTLGKSITQAKSNQSQLALIVMDLNRFKEVNDTLGHDIGDQLLCQISERLQALLGENDNLARMGGDEFAILLSYTHDVYVQEIIDSIIVALHKPFSIKGLLLEAETSLGIACYPEHGEDARTLIRHADTAMYLAKHHDELFAFYDQGKDPHSLKRLTLMSDLRRAIEEEKLELYYQPKANIGQHTINSAEALLRWQHPIYGYIQPNVFVDLAEQTGIIKPLTWWTLKTGIAQCARWHHEGLQLSMAINLSPRMLHDLSIPEEIQTLLNEFGLAPEYLELEITETAIMLEPERAQEILSQLHNMGVRLSIDDFGTGYTSLAYMKNLPVDEIKIDMSFVQGMLSNTADAMIVRSIIELAHNMKYEVVAEGVSSEALFQRLSEEGCEIAQGSFISLAMSANDFNDWVKDAAWTIPTLPIPSAEAVVLNLPQEPSRQQP
ncbi:MAG TPA: EAL domain-containing protein [Candidatus Tenderia electrophaga]|uniref:EAL domain-containing protein n=1 Tax=Candidatus Tenderia electrophaga TaxID=1748243 RepID=A0A832J7F8_9GAMM|nr:EAL domain-containing protein [Candidatus Tenderia electrophaga]